MAMGPSPWANYAALKRLQHQQQQNSFQNANTVANNSRNNGVYSQNQMQSILAHYSGLNQNNNTNPSSNDASSNFASTFGFNFSNTHCNPMQSNNHQLNTNNLNHDAGASLLSHHLPNWRHTLHTNLNINNRTHNHPTHDANNSSGPFGILPHQTVNNQSTSGGQHSNSKQHYASVVNSYNSNAGHHNVSSKSCSLDSIQSLAVKQNALQNYTRNNNSNTVNTNLLPASMGMHQNFINNTVSPNGDTNSSVNTNIKLNMTNSLNTNLNKKIQPLNTSNNYNNQLPHHPSQSADPYFSIAMNSHHHQQMLATINHQAQLATQRAASNNQNHNSSCVIASNSSSVNPHQYNTMNFQKNFMHNQNMNNSCLMSRSNMNMNNLNTIDDINKTFNNAMVNNTYLQNCSVMMGGIQINNYNVSNHNNLIISSSSTNNHPIHSNHPNRNSNLNLSSNNYPVATSLNSSSTSSLNIQNTNSNNSISNSESVMNNSRCSSVASLNNVQQINESSSCSYVYSNSPSNNSFSYNTTNNQNRTTNINNILNSSQQQLNNFSSNPLVTSMNQVNDFTNSTNNCYNGSSNNSSFTTHNNGTSSLATTPGYPTPPSSVNRSEIVSQNQQTHSQEDLMHFTPNNTQQQFNVINNNFNNSIISNNKLTPPATNSSPSNHSNISNSSSSCMIAAATLNGYLNHSSNNNLSLPESSNSESVISNSNNNFLPNLMNAALISDSISSDTVSTKLNDSQCSNNILNLNNQNHSIESNMQNVFNEAEIDIPSINLDLTPTNIFSNQDLPLLQNKKKKDKTKKKKKKVISLNNHNSNSNNLSNSFSNTNPFHYANVQQQYPSMYSNVANCNNYLLSNVHQQQILQQKQLNHNSMFLHHQNIENENQNDISSQQYQINYNYHHNHQNLNHNTSQQDQDIQNHPQDQQNHQNSSHPHKLQHHEQQHFNQNLQLDSSNESLINSQCNFNNSSNFDQNSSCHEMILQNSQNSVLSAHNNSNSQHAQQINHLNELSEDHVDDKLANLEDDLKFLTGSNDCVLSNHDVSNINTKLQEQHNIVKNLNEENQNSVETCVNSIDMVNSSINTEHDDKLNNSLNENHLIENSDQKRKINSKNLQLIEFENQLDNNLIDLEKNDFKFSSHLQTPEESIYIYSDKHQHQQHNQQHQQSQFQNHKLSVNKSSNNINSFELVEISKNDITKEGLIKKKKKKEKLKVKNLNISLNKNNSSKKFQTKNNKQNKNCLINNTDSILLGSSITITPKNFDLPLCDRDNLENNKIVNKLNQNNNITITPILENNFECKKRKSDDICIKSLKNKFDEYEFPNSPPIIDQCFKKRKKNSNCENMLKKKFSSDLNKKPDSKNDKTIYNINDVKTVKLSSDVKLNCENNLMPIINKANKLDLVKQSSKEKKQDQINQLHQSIKNNDFKSLNDSNKKNITLNYLNNLKNKNLSETTKNQLIFNKNNNSNIFLINNKKIITGKNINNCQKKILPNLNNSKNQIKNITLQTQEANVSSNIPISIGKNINNIVKNNKLQNENSLIDLNKKVPNLSTKNFSQTNVLKNVNKVPTSTSLSSVKIELNESSMKDISTSLSTSNLNIQQLDSTIFKSNVTPSSSLNMSVSNSNLNSNSVITKRRSNEKKALTIREGLMRTGDFVISLEAIVKNLPVIWRIEGKSLLQRFEPCEEDGYTLYQNTSSYSAWNPTVRSKYVGVDVKIMGCNRTKIVVEKLNLNKCNGKNNLSNDEKSNESKEDVFSKLQTSQQQANFEVFIQTLISQALDSSFIAEIIKENDEYFVSHVRNIDEYCLQKKNKLFSKIKWESNIIKCIETYPKCDIIPQENTGDLRCKFCFEKWSTQILNFTGEPYDPMTLEHKENNEMKLNKYAACDKCKSKVLILSSLLHHKYNFFIKCGEKVEEMRGGDENKESHIILEQCLHDTEWIQSLFKQLEEIWNACDNIK